MQTLKSHANLRLYTICVMMLTGRYKGTLYIYTDFDRFKQLRHIRLHIYLCVCAPARARARACVCVCVCVCVSDYLLLVSFYIAADSVCWHQVPWSI